MSARPSRDPGSARRRALVRRRRRRAAGGLLAFAAAIALLVLALSGSFAGKADGGGARGHAAAGADRGRSVRSGGGSRPHSPPNGPPGDEPVPILMYHVIAAPPAGAPFPGLYVPPAEFAEQMQALAHAGWHAVTLEQIAANWREGRPLPAGKPIVLTFDNGYNSQFTQALPVLSALGWKGVENIQLTGLPPSQGGLGEGQVRGLIRAGWELDTQGYSHADLPSLSAQELSLQVAGTRERLQHLYHVPVNWFCYPSGHYDAAVIAAVRAAGFKGSTTVVAGWAHRGEDPYRMHRLRVLGGTDGTELLQLIESSREDPQAPETYGT